MPSNPVVVTSKTIDFLSFQEFSPPTKFVFYITMRREYKCCCYSNRYFHGIVFIVFDENIWKLNGSCND